MNSFDYVVVGAGSAGSVVAARLSEDADITVAALEAGSRAVPPAVAEDIAIPSHWALVQHTAVDWQYESVPQPGLNGRRIQEPRGRLPGGTSNLYALMHIRGHRSDYDNWAYNGCPGWSFEAVLPYFRKLEDQEDDTNPTGGKGGSLCVASVERHDPNPTSAAFIAACLELGFPRSPDFNGPQMEGSGARWQGNYDNHYRWCADIPESYAQAETKARQDGLRRCHDSRGVLIDLGTQLNPVRE